MMHLTARWVVPWLALLAEWSVRWGVVIAMLAAWLALRPPQRTATRHLLCLAALVGGSAAAGRAALGHAVVPWPRGGSGRAQVASRRRAYAATASPEVPPPARPLPAVRADLPVADREVVHRPGRRRWRPVPIPSDRRPTRRTAGGWRRLAVAVAWAAVVLALLSRLAVGRLTLARLSARPWRWAGIGPPPRRVPGGDRVVAAGADRGASGGRVARGRRRSAPVVLVPTDWGDWPEPHRRACLLHELAHLARYDDWAKLAQELLRAPFFFHPSVRWLLARLDRERELLCDEAAVALGSDPVAYARLLLDLARRPGRLVPSRPRPVTAGSRSSTAVPSRSASSDSWRTTCSAPSLARPLLSFPPLGSLVRGRGPRHRGAVRVRAGSAGRDARRSPAPASRRAKRPTNSGASSSTPTAIPSPGRRSSPGPMMCSRSGHQSSRPTPRAVHLATPAWTELVSLVAYKDGLAASAASAPSAADDPP